MTHPRRILALDVGLRRTGLAATDPTCQLALPLPRLEHRDLDELLDLLARIVAERDIERIVVGLPLDREGRETAMSARLRAFAERLRARFPALEIRTADESLTTEDAHQRLKAAGLKAARRKKLADSIAALLILERHLAEL